MKALDPSKFSTWFSPYNQPALHVESGEKVLFTCRDSYNNMMVDENSTRDREMLGAPVNPLNGPVYVNGAMPGDTIKITIDDIRPTSDATFIMDDPGVCSGFRKFMTDKACIKVPINDGMADMFGVKFPIRPLIGCIGVAPTERSSTFEQGRHCGNVDCKEMVIGNSLYVPVFVPGGLVSAGDIHAYQGDGEIVSGLEVAGEIELTLEVIKGISEPWPVLESPERWYFLVSLEDMLEASNEACTSALQFILDRSDKFSTYQVITLLSQLGDVQTNEIVDALVSMRFGFEKMILPELKFEDKKVF